MIPVLNIGPAVVPTAPLLYILGAYIALTLVEAAAGSLQLDETKLYEIAAGSLFTGVFAARAAFVLEHFADFRARPISIIWPLTNGYNLALGVCIGLAFMAFQLWQQDTAMRSVQAILPGVLFLLFVISATDLLARPGVGTITESLFGIERAGIRKHPVEVYEAVVALGGLVVWTRLTTRSAESARVVWTVVGVVGFGRFLTDAFRANAPTLADGTHLLQLLLLPLILLTAWQLSRDPATVQPHYPAS